MPTEMSNALGTARQFMPRPANTYQERLTGINAPAYKVPQGLSNAEAAAVNLEKLNAAMLNYKMGREQRTDMLTMQKAEEILNGKTLEEQAMMDSVDIANQLYGDNPTASAYFIAHTERIRGENMASIAKTKYEEEYADMPAKSPEEEAARFFKFTETFKQNNMRTPVNAIAFDMGYNKMLTVNQKAVFDAHVSRDVNDRIAETKGVTKAELSKFSEDMIQGSPNTLDENTQKLQTIINQPRFAALPLGEREAMINEWIKASVKSGAIDMEELKHMLSNVTIATQLDGSNVKAIDLVDIHHLENLSNDYQMRYYIEAKDKIITEYGKDTSMTRFYTDGAKKHGRDKDLHYSQASVIKSMVNANNNNKRIGEIKEAKAALKYTAEMSQLKAAYTAYHNGMPNMANGFSTALDNVSLTTKAAFFNNEMAYYLTAGTDSETSAANMLRLLTWPPLREARTAYVSTMGSSLNLENLDDKGNMLMPKNVRSLLDLQKVDKGKFVTAFGADISQKVSQIQRFVDMSGGDYNKAFAMAYKVNTTDNDVKSLYSSALLKNLAWDDTAIETLGTIDTDTVFLVSSAEALSYIKDAATAYMCAGMEQSGAVQAAKDDFNNSFKLYHGGLIPRNTFNGMGTSNDEKLGQLALDSFIAEYTTEADVDINDIDLHYDTTNQTFTLTGGNMLKTYRLEQVLQKGQALIKEKPEIKNVLLTPEEINAARHPRIELDSVHDDA